MTVKVKIEHVNGNKALEVVDQNNNVHATLDAPGRSVEVTMHADLQLTVRETGEFFDAKPSGFGDATQQGGGERNPQRDHLPPGAGEPGSSVPDVRVPESETAPSPSSDDVPADRQAQNDAARTENSPTSTHGGPRGSI